ncbi:hypothetical protein JYT72_01955 [Crocinitomix catalasitica]|nr:hypothetical protein [Crocinitomix catalasitica]
MLTIFFSIKAMLFLINQLFQLIIFLAKVLNALDDKEKSKIDAIQSSNLEPEEKSLLYNQVNNNIRMLFFCSAITLPAAMKFNDMYSNVLLFYVFCCLFLFSASIALYY